MAAQSLLWPILVPQGRAQGMLIEKLASGVVQVQTPLGPRL